MVFFMAGECWQNYLYRKLFENLPANDACTYGDIERVLGALLRYFNGTVGQSNHSVAYTFYFIPEHQAQLLVCFYLKMVQWDTLVGLLYGDNVITFLFECRYCFSCVLMVGPCHGVGGTQCGLVNLTVRRGSGDARQKHRLHPESISGSEQRTHIVQASYIIQEKADRQLAGLPKLHDARTTQLLQFEFLHTMKIAEVLKLSSWRWCGALILLLALGAWQDTWKDVYSEKAWADRDRWQKADKIIEELKLTAASQVADIGCHEGYLTVKLAAVASRVYAVDIESGKLERLKVVLERRKITNVTPVLGKTDDPRLPESKLDAVVILDTYHEIRSHQEVLSSIYLSLKPGGRLVICDPIADERRNMSRAEQASRHEVSMAFVKEDLEAAGFKILREQEDFVDRRKEKGDRMWLLVASRTR